MYLPSRITLTINALILCIQRPLQAVLSVPLWWCCCCRPAAAKRPHLVLVLRAVGRVRLQGGEQVALGAGFGARIQLTQLKEVVVSGQLLVGQVRHHQAFLQEATALEDGTHDVRLAHLYLGSGSEQVGQWQ